MQNYLQNILWAKAEVMKQWNEQSQNVLMRKAAQYLTQGLTQLCCKPAGEYNCCGEHNLYCFSGRKCQSYMQDKASYGMYSGEREEEFIQGGRFLPSLTVSIRDNVWNQQKTFQIFYNLWNWTRKQMNSTTVID